LNITVIIPAHNEAPHISEVIKKCLKYTKSVFVIDDGSTDTTAILSRSSGAEVYCHPLNMGVGAALETGFAVTKKFDTVITIDGDGQHDADDMPKLIQASKYADVVIGSRFIDGIKIPKYRRFGIWMITLAYNFGHKPITDSQSGFRAYSRNFFDNVLIKETGLIEENGFGSITEILIKARKQGFKIAEVPISCSYRSLSQDSHMNPVRHGLAALWKTIYWRFKEWN
jgi:glycosyltransferase involved in cell wall biosynthesis